MFKNQKSKLALALCLVFLLALTGCDFFSGLFDPLIGTWSYSATNSGTTIEVVYEFHADDTWSQTLSQTGYADETVSGTYTHTASSMTLTATSGGTGTATFTYEVSSNRNSLTLSSGGSSVTLIRN